MAKKKIIKEEINEAVEVKEEKTENIIENDVVENIDVEDEAVDMNEEIEEYGVEDSDEDDVSENFVNEDVEMNYVDDLGFSVLKVLNSEQIEAIADFVNQYQTWTDRFYAKSIITLNIATDLTEEEVSSIVNGIDIIQKPFIYTVYDNILNWDFVDQAIEYYNSIDFKISNFANMLIALTEQADESAKEDAKEKVKNVVDMMRQKES